MNGFWSDRPTLVTGATGLLGSWLVRALVDHGAAVVCLVRDWVPQSDLVRSGLLDRVRVVRGDVRDQPLLERVLAGYDIVTVFHLAAQTIVGVAERDPAGTFDTNVRGTWTLLEAVRRTAPLAQVVVASSDKVYGPLGRRPADESDPVQPGRAYETSKACADLIARGYAQAYGLSVALTRCANLFGGGDLHWDRLVPGTIRALLRGERPVLRSNGRYLRDYLYVEDAVWGYLLLAERLAADPTLTGQAFNFGLEQPLTAREMVERIAQVMGVAVEPVVLDAARGEIVAQALSAARARRLLGWQPQVGLEEGLRRTVAWYREFLGAAPDPLPAGVEGWRW